MEIYESKFEDKNSILFSSAIQFRKAGLRCFEHPGNKPFEDPLPFAIIVNLSLSAELFLKYILELQGDNGWGHSLSELYNGLNEEHKNRVYYSMDYHLRTIQKNEEYIELGFQEMLNKHSELFYNYRYLHQTIQNFEGQKIHYGFLIKFTLVLKELGDILKNQNSSQS